MVACLTLCPGSQLCRILLRTMFRIPSSQRLASRHFRASVCRVPMPRNTSFIPLSSAHGTTVSMPSRRPSILAQPFPMVFRMVHALRIMSKCFLKTYPQSFCMINKWLATCRNLFSKSTMKSALEFAVIQHTPVTQVRQCPLLILVKQQPRLRSRHIQQSLQRSL